MNFIWLQKASVTVELNIRQVNISFTVCDWLFAFGVTISSARCVYSHAWIQDQDNSSLSWQVKLMINKAWLN